MPDLTVDSTFSRTVTHVAVATSRTVTEDLSSIYNTLLVLVSLSILYDRLSTNPGRGSLDEVLATLMFAKAVTSTS